ncbi:ABC transporter ATP-binding protein [uncultured Alteromonas sp.]|jgi:vitamin B12 transport system ATP-binding protein|uniref:ABC transporter ATP-binding protein n=1 Tax=uncultured Alteromonas sp. TaxID=179113 RepID=UPI0025CC7385|nr:ABC transporter ATP-binding protein [uncultured Alteromonas sp.]
MSQSIKLDNVCLDQRLSNISVTIMQPGITCLLGSNGAGKSSLLLVLAGLVEPEQGQVYWGQTDVFTSPLAVLSVHRCFVAQQHSIQFELTGRECLQFLSPSQSPDIPGELIRKLDIADLLDKPITRMSGGELQRIMISRALLQVWPAIKSGNAIIVLDEPLQGVDIRHQTVLMHWLSALAKVGNQIIMSCHDINIANTFADTVLLAKAGQMLAYGPTRDVLNLSNLWLTFDCQFECLFKDEQRHFIPVRQVTGF